MKECPECGKGGKSFIARKTKVRMSGICDATRYICTNCGYRSGAVFKDGTSMSEQIQAVTPEKEN